MLQYELSLTVFAVFWSEPCKAWDSVKENVPFFMQNVPFFT
jgi:hypothetical protein